MEPFCAFASTKERYVMVTSHVKNEGSRSELSAEWEPSKVPLHHLSLNMLCFLKQNVVDISGEDVYAWYEDAHRQTFFDRSGNAKKVQRLKQFPITSNVHIIEEQGHLFALVEWKECIAELGSVKYISPKTVHGSSVEYEQHGTSDQDTRAPRTGRTLDKVCPRKSSRQHPSVRAEASQSPQRTQGQNTQTCSLSEPHEQPSVGHEQPRTSGRSTRSPRTRRTLDKVHLQNSSRRRSKRKTRFRRTDSSEVHPAVLAEASQSSRSVQGMKTQMSSVSEPREQPSTAGIAGSSSCLGDDQDDSDDESLPSVEQLLFLAKRRR